VRRDHTQVPFKRYTLHMMWQFIDAKWGDRAESFLAIALAGFMMWPHNVTSILMIIWLVVRLLRDGRSVVKRWRVLLYWSVPALLVCAAWLGHGMSVQGWPEVQLMATWLALGLIVFSTAQVTLFRKSFVWMSLLQGASICLTLAIQYGTDIFMHADLMRSALQDTFGFHPTYLSAAWFGSAMIVALATDFKPTTRVWMTVSLMLFGLTMGGRMPMIAFVICLFATLVAARQWKFSAVLALVLALSTSLIYYGPGSGRLSELVPNHTAHMHQSTQLNSTQIRQGVWHCVYRSALQKPLLGYGVGNTRKALEDCYLAYNNEQYFETEYNSHNQYLHFLLAGGLFIFAGFMGWWIGAIWLGIRRINLLHIGVFSFAALLMLTENYFSRQSGITLIAVLTLTTFSHKQNSTHVSQKGSSKEGFVHPH
jgi:O-antigen ligase